MGVSGRHCLADLSGIDQVLLRDVSLISRALIAVAERAEMTPLSDPVVHIFPGGGLTAFLPLAESHIAIHTYPEAGYAAVDAFTCGERNPEPAIETIRLALRPAGKSVRTIARGVRDGSG